MTIRATIVAEIEEIAKRESITLPPLTNELPLSETGLDSLSMATLVASLEDRVGIDPFTASDEARFPVTFGDFVEMYEDALA